MAHLVFVDSSSNGFNAFHSARRAGDRVTFVVPRDLLFATMFGFSRDRLPEVVERVDRVIEVDDLSRDTLIDALHSLQKDEPIDALITVSEMALLPVAEAAAALGLRGNDPEALRTALFKDRCRAHLDAHGLRSAHHATIRDSDAAHAAADDIGYPVIIKATRSFGKLLAALCRPPSELDDFFKRAAEQRACLHPVFARMLGDSFIIEERLVGELCSAEVGFSQGRFLPLVDTSRKRAVHDELIEIGAFMPRGLGDADRRALFSYVERVLATIELDHGMFHVAVIMTRDGPALVEINPRMMGGTLPQMYGYVADLDPFALLIDLHADRPVEAARLRPRRAAGSLAVGARHEAVAPSDIAEKLTALCARYDLFENALRLAPGQVLPAFVSNFTAFGRLGFGAPDHVEAARIGRQFIAELEDALGCAVATY